MLSEKALELEALAQVLYMQTVNNFRYLQAKLVNHVTSPCWYEKFGSLMKPDDYRAVNLKRLGRYDLCSMDMHGYGFNITTSAQGK